MKVFCKGTVAILETELRILMLSAASLVSAYQNPKKYIFVAKMQILNASYTDDRSLLLCEENKLGKSDRN